MARKRQRTEARRRKDDKDADEASRVEHFARLHLVKHDAQEKLTREEERKERATSEAERRVKQRASNNETMCHGNVHQEVSKVRWETVQATSLSAYLVHARPRFGSVFTVDVSVLLEFLL